uniref:Glutathione-dependent formaldehyde dehydrogenase n=1 Tax=Roseihalotalea indica TaxID=2867963 RepID=A0AA49JH64_9BACT|nr:glutathione-dependent formaldehyde dehydrogenase [Tunicatimonas sp. TK19036]
MKALVYHKPKHVSVDTVPDPIIKDSRDAIIRVTSTAICGSDLHIYNGLIPDKQKFVVGHEFMGIVEETGTDVSNLKRGDRVVVPFPIGCGQCYFCQQQQLHTQCENSNPEFYGPEGDVTKGKGGALFGYTSLYGGYDGGQAEYVRVPYADFGPRKVPDTLTDEQALFLTDIFPTGYAGIDWANLQGGETVVVFGCGPVGIMAQKAAWLRGAKRVIGVDIQPYRLEKARQTAKVETINAAEEDVAEVVRSMTEGRGADVCVDAVGMEADRSIVDKALGTLGGQAGTAEVIENALNAVRRGGTVTVVGVYATNYNQFPFGKIFDKAITLKAGQAPVQRYIDRLIEHVQQGDVILDDIITHRLPLAEAVHGYEIFNEKKDNCVKVVLQP